MQSETETTKRPKNTINYVTSETPNKLPDFYVAESPSCTTKCYQPNNRLRTVSAVNAADNGITLNSNNVTDDQCHDIDQFIKLSKLAVSSAHTEIDNGTDWSPGGTSRQNLQSAGRRPGTMKQMSIVFSYPGSKPEATNKKIHQTPITSKGATSVSQDPVWTLNSYASQFHWVSYPGSPFRIRTTSAGSSYSYISGQSSSPDFLSIRQFCQSARGFETKRQMENAYHKAATDFYQNRNGTLQKYSRPQTTPNCSRPVTAAFSKRPNTTPASTARHTNSVSHQDIANQRFSNAKPIGRTGWFSPRNRSKIVKSSPPWRSMLNRRHEGLRAKESLCPNHCRCCFNYYEITKEENSVYRLDYQD